jgi:hypothetical protein
MKNLRKVLSVVLVVCLVFGLTVMASAKGLADYSDAASVTQKEAVDVMSALGIMTGADGTTFNPTGTFTREMAAKVIAYLMTSSAKYLTTTTSRFSDVEATRWSAPFIEYCASKGIINGTGDGTFAPTAPVTGSAFAKMLLGALGYGKNGEFVGSNWEINAIDMAIELGILTLDVNYSGPATREQVAQYALNALSKNMKVWDKDTEEYINAADGKKLGERQGIARADDVTVNGVTGHVWQKYGVDLTALYTSEVVLGTSTNGTAIATLMDTTSTKFLAKAASSYSIYVNGTEAKPMVVANTFAVGDYANDGGVLKVCTVAGTGTAGTFVAAPALTVGNIVKLIDTNPLDMKALVNKVAIIIKTVDVIGASAVKTVAGINGNPDSITVDLTIGADIAGTTKTVAGYDGLAKGDVVLYYKDGNGVSQIEKATMITGKLTGWSSDTKKVTISGTAYVLSAEANAKDQDYYKGLAANIDLNVFVDSNGYAVYVKGVEGAPVIDQVVLLGSALIDASGWTTTDKCEAKLLFPDGTVKVVNVVEADGVAIDFEDDNPSAADVYAEIDNIGEDDYGVFYTYDADVYGNYTLELTAPVDTAVNKDVVSNRAVFMADEDLIANSKTVFLVQSGTAPLFTYKSYTGIANVPNLTSADAQAVEVSGICQIVYLTGASVAPSASNLVFFYSLAYGYTGDSAPGAGDAFRQYTALVGTVTDTPVKVLNTVAIPKAGLYTVAYNADNVVIAATEVSIATGVEVGANTYAESGGVIRLQDDYYTYTDSTVVYRANANSTLSVKAIADITTDDNDVFYAFFNSSGTLTTVYIVRDAAVATANIAFDMTDPADDPDNEIDVDQTAKTVTIEVESINAIDVTITKLAGQTITVGGDDEDLVTVVDANTTTPDLTLDTSDDDDEGAEYEFTLTVTESGKATITYIVSVTVDAAP